MAMMLAHLLDNRAAAVVGTSVSVSALTASWLDALPTVVSVIAGILTIVFMTIQIAIAVRTWRRGHEIHNI